MTPAASVPAGRPLAALHGAVHHDRHQRGAGDDEAGQHVPRCRVLHGRRDDAGEGGPDGRVLETGHDLAGEGTQIGAEIPLIGHGYLGLPRSRL